MGTTTTARYDATISMMVHLRCQCCGEYVDDHSLAELRDCAAETATEPTAIFTKVKGVRVSVIPTCQICGDTIAEHTIENLAGCAEALETKQDGMRATVGAATSKVEG